MSSARAFRRPRDRSVQEEPMTTSVKASHSLEVPGAVLRYDVRESEPAGGPVLVMIGSPMGAAGFGTLADALHRPHGRDLRPAGRRAQRAHGPRPRGDARGARRRRAGRDRGGRRRPGRPVRQQRRRRQRAGPRRRRPRPRAAPSSPTSRRWPSMLPDATDALAACRPSTTPTMQHGFGAGMAHFIALVSLRGPVPADFAVAAATRSGDVRHARPRTTAPATT